MINSSPSGRQRFFDEPADIRKGNASSGLVRCLNWNIQNSSLQRAVRQAGWFETNNFDVIALTEIKQSRGGNYIKDRLESRGYAVSFPDPENGDYGALLAVKELLSEGSKVRLDSLSHRISSLVCDISGKLVLFIGMYAPGPGRGEMKKKFSEAFEKAVREGNFDKKFDGCVILGDMNILEPNHDPKYPIYKDWEFFYNNLIQHGFVDAFRLIYPNKKEHSWFGRDGNGYRFDHCFVSKSIAPSIKDCFYIHDARTEGFSDHSAMCLEIRSPSFF